MSSEIADIEARDAALKDAQERERLSMQGEPGIPDGDWVYAASQAEKDRRTLLQRVRELETVVRECADMGCVLVNTWEQPPCGDCPPCLARKAVYPQESDPQESDK